MFIVNHAAAGIIVGSLSDNPVLAFILGFLSHFPLDMIPHGDRGIEQKAKRDGKLRPFFIWLAVDLVALVILLPFGFSHHMFAKPWIAAWGAFGGVAPDMLVGIYEYFATIKHHAKPPLAWFQKIHEFNHNRIITGIDLTFGHGVIYQIAALAIFVKFWH